MPAISDKKQPFLNLSFRRSDEQIYVGHARNAAPRILRQLHRHPHYELTWLGGNDAVFLIDFEEYAIPEGSMVFIRAGQLHTVREFSNALDLFVIGFAPELVSPTEIQSLPYFLPTAVPFLSTDEVSRPILANLFATIHQHYRASGEENRDLLAAYVRVLLAEANRLYRAATVPSDPSAVMQLTKSFQLAVEQHYLTDRSTQPYAQRLGVTPNYLTRVIRQTTGATPGDILRARLTLEAKRLLAHSEYNVSETAQQLGFLSAAQFSNWFKREAGISPDQFRKQFREA